MKLILSQKKSMTKQRDKACKCKQDINRILLLDSDSLGFEFFGFGILNCPSLDAMTPTMQRFLCLAITSFYLFA